MCYLIIVADGTRLWKKIMKHPRPRKPQKISSSVKILQVILLFHKNHPSVFVSFYGIHLSISRHITIGARCETSLFHISRWKTATAGLSARWKTYEHQQVGRNELWGQLAESGRPHAFGQHQPV